MSEFNAWYVAYTKPKQERCALENLERQGYECYLPLLPVEKIARGSLSILEEPLFPRYLFIRQVDRSESGLGIRSWVPIRSTKGVSRLVSFGPEPARVSDELVAYLREQQGLVAEQPRRLFNAGDRVQMTQGAFAGIEGIYQMADGERRAMVLIELLSKPVTVRVSPASLRKAS